MTGELDDLSDADLIVRAREGDSLAYGVLWKRHWPAARTMATSITGRFDPDDLASEAFARILTSICRGKGPTAGFRSYLATTVRNVAIDWSRRKSTPNIEDADAIEDWTFSEATALDRIDRETMAEAFYALPVKWQEVLWYTEIEDMAPREVAPLMGLSPNAVSALALRAREGLRQSWINAHLASAPSEDPIHGWTLKKLGPLVRGRLTKADRRKVLQHLGACRRCADAASEADRVGSRLALGILPLFLGLAGATAYLSAIGATEGAVAAGVAHPAVALHHGARLRHLSATAAGSSKAGMAAVVASVAAAAALTYGAVIAAPQSDPTSAGAGDGSTSGQRNTNGDGAEPQAPRVTPEQKDEPKPDAAAELQPDDGDGPAPSAGGPLESGSSAQNAPSEPTDQRPEAPLPPHAGKPAPQGCVAALEAIPAAETLFAYRLDDEAGASTATDLVHGNTARYTGHPGDGEWSLTDNSLRVPVDRFTVQIWFSATAGGGRLVGFSGSTEGASAYYDRHLFLTDDGRLVFGVFPDAVRTISSDASYTDGRWHQATATLSEEGMALYVDGERIAHDPSVTQAHQFSGRWRIGADNLDNWGPETPSSRQITGSLAFAAVYGTALSADQVRTQWNLCS